MAQEVEVKASWKGVIPDCLLMLIGIGLFTILFKIPEILVTSITISPKMVSGKTGVFKKQSLDEPIRQITSVKVEQGVLGRMCGYGTVIINSMGSTIAFRYIDEPNKVKNTIMHLIEQVHQS